MLRPPDPALSPPAFPRTVVLLVLAALGLSLATPPAALGDDDDPPLPSDAGNVRVLEGGQVAVVLDDELREAIGVQTEALVATEQRERYGAWVEVVDTSPLLVARSQYALSKATESVSEVDMQTARAEYRRLVDLGERGRIVSPQELRRAQGEFQRQQALVRTEQIRQLAIRDELAQGWSPQLADAVLSGNDPLIGAVVERERVLLRLTLPPGRSLVGEEVAAEQARVAVLVPAGDDRAPRRLAAQVVAPAPGTDERLQGETWWLSVPSPRLRTGMRLAAEVQAQDVVARRGALVPSTAVVWHDGRPWVYVAAEDEELAAAGAGVAYVRQDLSAAIEQFDGWFASVGIEPGQEVVVRGATTLLSEEYRWQIPTEDDDDDD